MIAARSLGTDAYESNLGRLVLDEQQEWADFVARSFGSEALLTYVSPLDSDRRMYRHGSRIAKIRRLRRHPEQSRRQFGQDLRSEYEVMVHLSRINQFDRRPSYEQRDEWEILE